MLKKIYINLEGETTIALTPIEVIALYKISDNVGLLPKYLLITWVKEAKQNKSKNFTGFVRDKLIYHILNGYTL